MVHYPYATSSIALSPVACLRGVAGGSEWRGCLIGCLWVSPQFCLPSPEFCPMVFLPPTVSLGGSCWQSPVPVPSELVQNSPSFCLWLAVTSCSSLAFSLLGCISQLWMFSAVFLWLHGSYFPPVNSREPHFQLSTPPFPISKLSAL